jgi:superfamily II DNA/RNA helicase
MFFVLDEADDLIKQKDELETDVKMLKDFMSPGHRTLLFSATFDADAQKVAETFVRTGYYFVSVGIMNAAVDSVEHFFIPVSLELLKLSGS